MPDHLRSSSCPDSPKETTSKDRKSTRLNSSHSQISYAVFCLKKKKKKETAEVMNVIQAEVANLVLRHTYAGVILTDIAQQALEPLHKRSAPQKLRQLQVAHAR